MKYKSMWCCEPKQKLGVQEKKKSEPKCLSTCVNRKGGKGVKKLNHYRCSVLTATADGSIYWWFKEEQQQLESYLPSRLPFFHIIGGFIPYYVNTKASELCLHSEAVNLILLSARLRQWIAKQFAGAPLDSGGCTHCNWKVHLALSRVEVGTLRHPGTWKEHYSVIKVRKCERAQ